MVEQFVFDSYHVLTTEIASALTADNIRGIKFLLRQCGRGVLEKVVRGEDLIQLMEDRCLLSAEKVDYLSDLLRKFGRMDLVNKIKEYIDSAISKNLSNHDYYGLNGMHVKDHYMEISDYRRLLDHMKQKQLAIIQGPPGSWKMQHAFRYAHTFSDAETKASGNTPVIWRIDCNQDINIYNSLSHLMNYLKIQCVYSKNQMTESIHTMVSRATETLVSEKYKNTKHLFILFGFISPQTELMDDIIKHLKTFKNISMIVSVNTTLTGESKENVIKMQGMTEEEAIEFLKVKDDDSKGDVKEVAKKLSYLPDGLVFAHTYIEITDISIKTYLTILEGISGKDDLTAKACEMVYVRAREKMSAEEKKLLRFLPYLNTDNIPIFVLKTLLPQNLMEDVKEIILNNFLLTLNNNSLITIKGVDNDRVITGHAYTLRIMKGTKTETEKKENLMDLLNYFTYYLDLDARLLEVIHRNVLLVDHAETFLNNFENVFQKTVLPIDAQVQLCYLYSAVGITYRLYGNTELSADSYFKKAKRAMYKMIEAQPVCFKDTQETLDYYLNGGQDLQEHTRRIFENMMEKGKELSQGFIERFLQNKCWSSRTIHLLCKYGGLDVNDITNNQLQRQMVDYLRKKNLIMLAEDITEIFIVELMIRLMYNSSKNTWSMEMSKDEFSSSQKGKLREQLSCSNLPVTAESLNAQQIACRLTVLLEDHIKSKKTPTNNTENKIRSFRPIFGPVTKRSGILYMLRSLPTNENLSQILGDAIQICEKMDIGIDGIGFTEFGVVKRIEKSSLYHIVMVDCIKMEYYLKLSKIDANNKENRTQAIFLAEKIEDKIDELTAFRAQSGIHLKIAKVFMLAKSDENIRKAKYHYRRAYDREYECNNLRLTRYHLKALIHYTECCLQHPTVTELATARTLCLETQQRLNREEIGKMFDDVIKDIDNKLESLKTSFWGNSTNESESEFRPSRTRLSRFSQQRIEELIRRKEMLNQMIKETDEEIEELLAMKSNMSDR